MERENCSLFCGHFFFFPAVNLPVLFSHSLYLESAHLFEPLLIDAAYFLMTPVAVSFCWGGCREICG